MLKESIREKLASLNADENVRKVEYHFDEDGIRSLHTTYYILKSESTGFHLFAFTEAGATTLAGKYGTLSEIYYNLRSKEYYVKRNERDVKFSSRNINEVLRGKNQSEILKLIAPKEDEYFYIAMAFLYRTLTQKDNHSAFSNINSSMQFLTWQNKKNDGVYNYKEMQAELLEDNFVRKKEFKTIDIAKFLVTLIEDMSGVEVIYKAGGFHGQTPFVTGNNIKVKNIEGTSREKIHHNAKQIYNMDLSKKRPHEIMGVSKSTLKAYRNFKKLSMPADGDTEIPNFDKFDLLNLSLHQYASRFSNDRYIAHRETLGGTLAFLSGNPDKMHDYSSRYRAGYDAWNRIESMESIYEANNNILSNDDSEIAFSAILSAIIDGTIGVNQDMVARILPLFAVSPNEIISMKYGGLIYQYRKLFTLDGEERKSFMEFLPNNILDDLYGREEVRVAWDELFSKVKQQIEDGAEWYYRFGGIYLLYVGLAEIVKPYITQNYLNELILGGIEATIKLQEKYGESRIPNSSRINLEIKEREVEDILSTGWAYNIWNRADEVGKDVAFSEELIRDGSLPTFHDFVNLLCRECRFESAGNLRYSIQKEREKHSKGAKLTLTRTFRYNYDYGEEEQIRIYGIFNLIGDTILKDGVDEAMRMIENHNKIVDEIIAFIGDAKRRLRMQMEQGIRLIFSDKVSEYGEPTVSKSSVSDFFSAGLDPLIPYMLYNKQLAKKYPSAVAYIKQMLTPFDDSKEFDGKSVADYPKVWRNFLNLQSRFEDRDSPYFSKGDSFDLKGYAKMMTINLSHNTEVNALFEYLFYKLDVEQAIDVIGGLGILIDYIYAVEELGYSNFDKLPRSLKLSHDIAVRNQREIRKYSEDDSNDIVAKYHHEYAEHFEYEGEKFSILYPNSALDLGKEGNALNHCVGGYTRNIENGMGDLHILFVRSNKNLEKPLYTLEIRHGEIRQFYGNSNTRPKEDAYDFIHVVYKTKVLKEYKKNREKQKMEAMKEDMERISKLL